jgi:hypothetical protein
MGILKLDRSYEGQQRWFFRHFLMFFIGYSSSYLRDSGKMMVFKGSLIAIKAA